MQKHKLRGVSQGRCSGVPLPHTLNVGIVQRHLDTRPSAVKLQFGPGHLGEMLGIFVESFAHIFTSAAEGIRCEASASLLQAPVAPSSLGFLFCALYLAKGDSSVLSQREKAPCLAKV